MGQQRVAVKIKGLSALLMHRYPLEPIENPPIEKRTKEDQAELAAYRDPETTRLYVPGVAVQRCLVNAASYSKGKGRATLVKPAAACLLVTPEYVDLGTEHYEIDARAVVVPATKGRVVRFRPRLNEWQCAFELDFDESLLSEKQVRQIVDDAGSRVGLLDYRPEKKGPFGRFVVVEWSTS
jgi:hypothetical protein